MLEWLPLIDLPEVRLTAGVLNGRWCVRGHDGTSHFLDTSPVAFLPFLEISLGELHRCLSTALQAVDLEDQNRPVWPTEQVVRIGLSAWGRHWPTLALDRLDETNTKSPFLDELTELARRGESQSIRHRAQKLARMAEKEIEGLNRNRFR